MLRDLYECALATRPLTFTASLVPVLVTAALVTPRGSALLSYGLLRAAAMGVLVQAGANLTNTCAPASASSKHTL